MSTGTSTRCLTCRFLALHHVAVPNHYTRLGLRNLRPLQSLVRPFSTSLTLRSDKDNGKSPPKIDADEQPEDSKPIENQKKPFNTNKQRKYVDFLGKDFNMGKGFKEGGRTRYGKAPQAQQKGYRQRGSRDRKDSKGPESEALNRREMYRKDPKTTVNVQRKVRMGESFLKFQKTKFMGFQWDNETDSKEEDFRKSFTIQGGKDLESMFQGIPYDVFTEDDYKSPKETVKTLFDVVAEEEREEEPKGLLVSAYDEQLRWTKQGKMWHFPIDNEQGWEEEKKYSFQDHVFFDEQLEDFPKRGPVRHFMELVTSALAMNHHLTVEEKHETIAWYKNYFIKQEKLLKEKFGKEGAVQSETNTSS